jgi:hypothetical protein
MAKHGLENRAARYIGKRLTPTDIRSNVIFQKAKDWIWECDEEHGGCPRRTKPLLPSRVIGVGDDDHEPRLYLNKPGDRGRYATLSYFWGENQAYVASAVILQQMTAAIPMAKLGQSIQDAIYTTRKIGIPYIWIDALCIVQDDDDDKGRRLVSWREFTGEQQ